MKIVVSQDGQQVFTLGENNLINIAPVEIENQKTKPFSIGIESVSFGIYKDKAKAEHVLGELVKFLCSREERYTMPADTK